MLESERERYRFTADDYNRMAEAGVLDPCVRVELIDGDFYLMSPIDPPHGRSISWLTQKLVLRLGESAIVRVQDDVQLGVRDIPQPDLAVLRARQDFYGSRRPEPEDVLLVIEVSESTLRTERYVKLPKYAAAGIAEAWLVDLVHHVLLVHTQPRADGYGEVRTLKAGDTAVPTAFPQVELDVAQLLG